MENTLLNLLDRLNRFRRRNKNWLVYALAAVAFYNLHDVLFDAVLTLLHSLFEWFEFLLEELIQHLFDTTRQQTQTIVFYLLLAMASFGFYRLGQKLIGIARLLPAKTKDHCVLCKLRLALYWQQQSTVEKLKLILSGSASLVLAAFWAFS